MTSPVSYFSRDFVKRLSIPRLVGTEGEKDAQTIIEEEFKKLNVEKYEKQPFYTSNFRNTLLRYYDVVIGFYMVLFYLALINLRTGDLFTISFVIVGQIGIFLVSYRSRSIKEHNNFKRNEKATQQESFNYIVELPSQQENTSDQQNTVVLLTHYDSKSLILPPIFEGAIYFFGLVGGSLFALHGLLVILLWTLQMIPTIYPLQFIYIFVLIPLYCIEVVNKTGNASPGANDNACGVASGMYIIDYLKEHPLQNTKVVAVFTGAEEIGELGAYNFIKKYHPTLSEKNTYFLIIDSPGGNKEANLCFWGQGLPKRSYSEMLYQTSKEVLNNNKDLKMDFFYIPPLIPFTTDHTPLKLFGNYEFLIFSSNNRWHSEADNIENYIPEMLENFFSFLKALVIQMDQKI